MDRDLDVRTPESIALTYHLAGLGSRFLALAIDMAIQGIVAWALLLGLVMAASRMALAGKPPPLSGNEKVVEAIAIALLVTIVFAIFFGYFIAFEALWSGRTPGKKIVGVRVVRDGGYPIDFAAALIRNLIRVGEALVGAYGLSAIAMLVSPENKRLGDIAAGTIVVRESRLALPAVTAETAMPEPSYGATRYLSGEERALVKRFLERRDGLAPAQRRDLALRLADRIRPRLPADLRRIDDESLLERL